jgi:hypothetical protein
MRYCGLLAIVAALAISSLAQNDADGPIMRKPRKRTSKRWVTCTNE